MAHGPARFTGINFSDAVLIPWDPDYNHCGQGFRCERSEFASHYKKRVPRDVECHLCQCWVILDNNKLVGFITLLADRLKVYDKPNDHNERHPRKILKSEGIKYRRFPAIKIGLLAVNERATGMGAGRRLIEWAIDYVVNIIVPKMGVRFLTVDALYDKDTGYDISEFYTRFGFEYVKEDEALPPKEAFRTLFLDLKYAIEIERTTG